MYDNRHALISMSILLNIPRPIHFRKNILPEILVHNRLIINML